MKKFISLFFVVILLLAFAIGQCNNTTEEYAGEMVSLYSYTEEEDEGEENVVTPALLPPNIPSQLLSRTAYCLSYNKETRCPNWARGAFVGQFDNYMAKSYYVDGARGEAKRIALPREMVVWE